MGFLNGSDCCTLHVSPVNTQLGLNLIEMGEDQRCASSSSSGKQGWTNDLPLQSGQIPHSSAPGAIPVFNCLEPSTGTA